MQKSLTDTRPPSIRRARPREAGGTVALRRLAVALLLTGTASGLAACTYQVANPTPFARSTADRQAIAHVQSELGQLGMYGGPIDGAWGPESHAALASFQQSRGLPPSGEPDQPSLRALAAAASGVPAPGTVIPSIAQVQQQLQQLGYYRSGVDGVWGPQTRRAMASFQRDEGLQATGQGDMISMNRLAQAAQASATGSGGAASSGGALGTSRPPPNR